MHDDLLLLQRQTMNRRSFVTGFLLWPSAFSCVEPLGEEVEDDGGLRRRRVQADALRRRGRGRAGHHAEARRGVDGEAGALRRAVDQLQRPPGPPGQALEPRPLAPGERHVLRFFMYMGAPLGPPALLAAVCSAC